MDKLMSSALLDKIMKVMGNNTVLMSFIKLRWLQHAHHRQEVALVVSGKLHEEHSTIVVDIVIPEYCFQFTNIATITFQASWKLSTRRAMTKAGEAVSLY